MNLMKLSATLLFVLAATSVANAVQSPKFNNDRKMKAKDVFKKCGDWAKKETASLKEGTSAEKNKKYDEYLKLANSCSLNNGFDGKGK